MTKSLPGPGVNENKFQRLCLINKIYVCENAYENGVIFSPKKGKRNDSNYANDQLFRQICG